MTDSSVEETHNGVSKEGDLDDIKEFAGEVEEAMEDAEVEEESVKEFRRWRPREDDGEEEMKEKTVEAARTSEKELEKESEGPVKDVEKAGEKVAEAGKKVRNGENPDPELKDASRDFIKPVFSGAAKTFRRVEEKVYSNLMLPLNGYYFDADDLAVDVRNKKNGEYRMDVKMTEEEKSDELKKNISEKQE
ncbi:MAG: DUF5828 family protein [Candidatus Nanosalina sp.]